VRPLAARLATIARRAVADCEAGALVERALAGRGGAPFVVGAGKAVEAMAEGARRALGDRARFGPLIAKDLGLPYDMHALQDSDMHAGLQDEISAWIMRASHPLPDERGARATERLLAFLAARGADGEGVLLLSGGASALLAAPVEGLTVEDLRAATRALLDGGLPIAEVNAVRKHLGRALGGRLALATAARLEVLALSDVIGDDPTVIGSGPAAPDPGTFAEALAAARRAGVTGRPLAWLERGVRGLEEETPKPGDPRFDRVRHRILATPRTLRERAAARAAEAGLAPLVVEELVAGDVGVLARRYADQVGALAPRGVLVAVGEPTVRVRGRGRGGRAQQLALDVALRLAGSRFAFVALGSDGSDGPTDAAGAAVDGETIAEASRAGFDPRRALDDNDAYPLLDAAGALLRTGATGTNLLDLHLLAIAA
jgi:glycerate-2-kinase